MFYPGSRYEKAANVIVTTAHGRQIVTVRLPLPTSGPLRGFHRRLESQRLDLIAAHYNADATTFWRLCDANNALLPDALAAHDLIGIPFGGG